MLREGKGCEIWPVCKLSIGTIFRLEKAMSKPDKSLLEKLLDSSRNLTGVKLALTTEEE